LQEQRNDFSNRDDDPVHYSGRRRGQGAVEQIINLVRGPISADHDLTDTEWAQMNALTDQGVRAA